MINTKFSLKNNGSIGNGTRSRSRSIYRGNKLHTTSMNLKIQCDMSPQTVRKPKQQQKTYKQLFKQNKVQILRQSLKLLEGISSNKKSQKEEKGEKSNKSTILQRGHPQTERYLKQTTNLTLRKQISMRTQKATINLGSLKRQQAGGQDQRIAISQHDLKQLMIGIKKLQRQNATLKQQLRIYERVPRSTVAMAVRMYD